MKKYLSCLLFLGLINLSMAQSIKGAWKSQQPNNSTAMMIVADDYLMIASYSVLNKYFDRTEGGTFSIKDGMMTYTTEFNSTDTSAINKSEVFTVERTDQILTLRNDDRKLVWMLVDDAKNVPMAGTWHITGRANQSGEIMQIHQRGTRKT